MKVVKIIVGSREKPSICHSVFSADMEVQVCQIYTESFIKNRIYDEDRIILKIEYIQ